MPTGVQGAAEHLGPVRFTGVDAPGGLGVQREPQFPPAPVPDLVPVRDECLTSFGR
ncbi:hypothetical protein [Streptomyces sp. NPDC058664]|uniref:hypothetical protein n=1 Tax=unclassified Streptomyces TaxID=2593676 RepID=UPI00364AB5E9